MEGWGEVCHVPVFREPKIQDHHVVEQRYITTGVFDENSELIWIGTSDGFLVSFNYTESPGSQKSGKSLLPYTSFRCFNDRPILEILPHSSGIIALSTEGIKFASRTGIVKGTFNSNTDTRIVDLQSMSYFSSSQSEIIVGSYSSNELLKIDLFKVKNIVQTFKFDGPNIKKITSNNKYIILAKVDASVDIMDPNSGEIVKKFPATTQAFNDLYCKEQTLITCGCTQRGQAVINDRFVNMIDLRLLKSMPPVAFPAGAAYARLHPKFPTIAIIASQSGLIHFTDVFNQANANLYQANIGAYMSFMAVSSSGDFLIFADSFQNLHLWSHNATSNFTRFNIQLDYGLPYYPSHTLPISLDNYNVPLSAVGMPYYKETLLSSWPYDSKWKVKQTPAAIDPEIVMNAKKIENTNIGFSMYDVKKYGHRNVAVGDTTPSSESKIEVPKFISEKEDEQDVIGIAIFDYKPKSSNVMPQCYNRLEILYSKFGVDDFDFDFFNRTKYSGLETHTSNSYCNAILQLYRFAPGIFNYVIRSLAEEDLSDDSLTAELGYLFDMLVKANGRHCNASNFQKVLNSILENQQLELNDDRQGTNTKDEYARRRLMQNFNMFLMDRLAYEEDRSLPQGTPLDQRQLGRTSCIAIAEEVRGVNYQMQAQRVRMSHALDVMAPVQARSGNRRINLNILNYIEESVNIKIQKTMGPQIVDHTAILKTLPDLLSLNLNLNNVEMAELKSYRKWLLPEFYAFENNSGSISFNTVATNFSRNVRRYELIGYVAEITAKDNENHFVAVIKIQEEKDGKLVDNWYLFNDFLVLQIDEFEAFNFNYWWKKPAILLYNNVSQDNKFDLQSWKQKLNDSVLYKDHFTNAIRENLKIEYKLLTRQEAPTPGTFIAIDAEFVNLTKEKVEIQSDGKRSIVRPKRQALARVSVLRGEGDQEGVPFIDDYIVIKDHIQDYLTSFSGIESGDLDPATSDKPLVKLNVAYRKLWLLLNLGCVFIGHGLSSDFRAINIQVPPEQVRDTAIYFYLKQYKRKLSLKFLTYVLLNERVQTGDHDSIEDAKSALKLYKKYLDLEASGELNSTLSWIYSEGRNLRFKVPT